MQCDSSLVTRKELLLGGIGLVAVDGVGAVAADVKLVDLRQADVRVGARTDVLVDAVQRCLQVSVGREHLLFTPLFSSEADLKTTLDRFDELVRACAFGKISV